MNTAEIKNNTQILTPKKLDVSSFINAAKNAKETVINIEKREKEIKNNELQNTFEQILTLRY